MPTIDQLPNATSIDPADEIPISQAGVARATSVGTLLAGTQPAILVASGTLLGRISLGPGGPEPVAIGIGLDLNGGAVAADGTDHAGFPAQTVLQTTDEVVLNSAGSPRRMPLGLLRGLFSAGSNVAIDGQGVISAAGGTGGSGGGSQITFLPQVNTVSAGDLVGISQAGGDHAVTYTNFLAGQTIDQVQPAAPATDTDTFFTGQASNVLVRQTLASVWTWVAGHLPGYRRPVVELTTSTTLDGSAHNGRILVCSAPITLTPAFANMGSGFFCDVVNLSSGSVAFAPGITTSTGATTLASGQLAVLRAVSYSGGSVVFASLAGAAATVAAPGQVTGLAAGAPTSSSMPLTWSPPASGGAPAAYTVQYRITGTSSWTTASTAVVATAYSVAGLAASTSYDFEVFATNGGGAGPASPVITAATAAAATQPPGQVTGLSAGIPTSSTVPLSWTAPGTGGAPSGYTVQYRVSLTTTWNTAGAGVIATSYAVSGLAASTAYDFQIIATNAAGSGPASAVVSATTAAATLQVPGQVTGLAAGAPTSTTVPLTWVAPTGGGAPAAYTVQFRATGTTPWTTATSSVAATGYSVGGLSPATGYDFQVFATNASGSGASSPIVSAATTIAAPGTVTGLSAGTTTGSSVALTWTSPTGGGPAASYTVQYRVNGTSSWNTATSTVTVTAYTVTGLTGSTAYDFQVFATNPGGAGAASAILTVSTATVAATTITWGPLAPAASYAHSQGGIGINVHANPTPPGVQFGWSSSASSPPASWTAAAFVNSDLWGQYISAPATAGTYFLWASATNGSGSLVSSAITIT